MATVIDELVLKLGLDPKDFVAGSKKAEDSLKKTRDGLQKQGRDIEDSTKKSIGAFEGLATAALEAGAVMIGAIGIKEFVRQTATMGLELGRTATLLDSSANMLATWQGAAVLTGGTIAGMTSSIRSLVGAMIDLNLTGNTAALPLMASLGVRPTFNKDHVLDYNKFLIDAATGIEKNHVDKAYAAYVLNQLGQDDATTALILSGPENVKEKLALAHEYAPSEDDVKNLTDLATAWNTLDLAVKAFGRDLVLLPYNAGAMVGDVLAQNFVTPKRVAKTDPGRLALYAPGKLLEATAGEVTGFFGPTPKPKPAPSPSPVTPSPTTPPAGADMAAWSAAVSAQQQYGIPASVTYAQWALESAHGTRMPKGSNNPFGIKAHGNQPYVTAPTHEMVDGKLVRRTGRFRKFPSVAAAFAYRAKMLATSKLYANARSHEDDPDAFADALTGVYATDRNYGAKLKNIMHSRQVQELASQFNNSSTRTVQNEVHIDNIVINSQATDANGIARDIDPAIRRNLLASLANSGQQ